MIYYMCRYAPEEILRVLGAQTEYLEPKDSSLAAGEAILHPMCCSFAKAAYGELANRLRQMSGTNKNGSKSKSKWQISFAESSGVLFTSCCDATRRLYDAIKAEFPGLFIYMFDLPAKNDVAAQALYRENVEKLTTAYSKFAGIALNAKIKAKLQKVLASAEDGQKTEPFEIEEGAAKQGKSRIGIVGAKVPPALYEAVEKCGAKVVFNATCAGQKNGSLAKYPCMRMLARQGERAEGLLEAIEKTKAQGLIYHTLKFCENYSYEYADLLAYRKFMNQTDGSRQEHGRKSRETALADIPLLKLETEYADAADSGQLATRIEAFLETLE